MGLKFKIEKTEFESLDESLKALYSESGEGYQLTVEGMPKPEDVSGLKSKVEELLAEKKAESEKRKAAEQEAQRKAAEAAKQQGDFESLFKSSEQKRLELEENYNSLKNKISSEKVTNEAFKIASKLADGTNAELLADFIKPRLKFADDGLKVLDQTGNLTVSTTDDLVKEFQTSGRYDALLRGSQATGGGAAGSGNGGGAAKTMTRADFDGLDASKKMEFVKSGGDITD